MTAVNLRLLADCLERGFMTDEDRRGWVNDLRSMANGVERGVMAEGVIEPAVEAKGE